MKKSKRMLSIVLCIALVLSLGIPTAFAEGNDFLTISSEKSELAVDESVQLDAQLSDEKQVQDVVWSISGGSDFAVIDQSGLLTGVLPGNVTVKASVTTEDGEVLEASKEFTVLENATEEDLSAQSDATVLSENNEDASVKTPDAVVFETLGGKECVFANGTPITIKEIDGVTKVVWTQDGEERSIDVTQNTNIFGGAHNSDTVIPSTSITMESGTVFSITGGGLHKSNCTQTSIVMNGGKAVGGIQGGGCATLVTDSCVTYNGEAINSTTQVGEANVTVNDGNTIIAYGGGEGISNTESATLEINGGTVGWATAAGSNGRTGNANIIINGGSITVAQTVNRGSVDSASITVPADSTATIDALYVGGETGDSSVTGTAASIEAKIMGGSITNFDMGTNGGELITKDDATAKVEYDASKITNVEQSVIDYTDNSTKVTDEATLKAALADESVSVIKLDGDITFNAPITIERDVTIDLNGHVLTATGTTSKYKIITKANVTFKDSVGTGKYTYTGADTMPALIQATSGKVTIESGIYETVVTSRGGSVIYLSSGAQAQVLGGTLTTAMGPAVNAKGSGSSIVVNGGSVICTGEQNSSTDAAIALSSNTTFTLISGTIKSASASGSVINGAFGNAVSNIEGGSVEGNITLASGNTLNLNGGSVSGNIDATKGTLNAQSATVSGDVEVNTAKQHKILVSENTYTVENHNMSDWTVRTPATTTVKGEEVRTCSVCSYEETREISTLNLVTEETIGGNQYVFANGTPITIKEIDGVTKVVWTQEGKERSIDVTSSSNIFGGSHNSDEIIPSTSVTMESGAVRNIFGGGLHKSVCTKTNVTINGGSVTGLQGAGASSLVKDACGNWYSGDPENSPTQVGTAHLTVNGGNSYLVFGGGEGISNTENISFIVNGGTLTYVNVTSSNGRTGFADMIINGGNIGFIQTINRGTTDSVSVIVPGDSTAEITDFYVGGETGDSSVTATAYYIKVSINGGSVTNLNIGKSGGQVITKDNPIADVDYKEDLVENVDLSVKKYLEKEHVFGDWTVKTPATCIANGEEIRTCTICGAEETRVIPRVDHTYSEEWTTDVEATCTSAGIKSHHCTTEGCTAKDEVTIIPALGHSFGDWTVKTPATCIANGEEIRTCTICGAEETKVIPRVDHTYSEEWTTDVAATCTSAGIKSHHCTTEGCTAKDDVTIIPAPGHSFGDWTVKTPATCAEKGIEVRKCAVCEAEETRATDALGHKYGAYVVDVEPSYSKDGSGHMTCETCGYVYTNVITKYVLSDVENFTAETNSYNSIKLSWDKVAGADGYIIYRSESENGDFTKLTTRNGSTTSVINKQNVEMGKRYYYKIVPFVNEESGRFLGNESAVVSAVAKIGQVTNFAAEEYYGTIELSWDKVADADGYIIYRSETQVGGYVRHVNIKNGDTTSVNITKNVEVGKTYYFKIKPYKLIDGKIRSNGVYGPVSETFKLAPIDEFDAAGGNGTIELSWNKVANADGYIIYRATSENGIYSNHVRIKNGDATQVTITKYITSGSEYYFIIEPYKIVDGEEVVTGTYGPASAVA